MEHRDPFGGLTIKTALALGFGVTLGIWLIAGYYFTKRITDTERRAAAINARYTQAQELLSTVQAQVLLGSVYVRDALLDPNPAPAEYRTQLQATYDTVHRALQDYVPVLGSAAELERIGNLQEELDAFRKTTLQVVGTDSSRWSTDVRTRLRTEISPRRESVFRITEEVRALNRNAFVQEQKEIGEVYLVNQRRLWQSLGLALAASFGIAVLAARYAGRLEHGIRHRQEHDAQNVRELQRLSAQLITAQEEERRTIARELHDEVGQVLSAIRVELTVAQRAMEANGADPRMLEDVRSVTDGAVATVRDLSHLLHPALLDDLGLSAAIAWYLRGFTRRHAIRGDVVHDDLGERLVPEIEASVYRIVQEALNNVAKHAQAASCRVYLQRLTHTLLVTVEDDGVGFDPADVRRIADGGGLGLIGIRERVAQLRGTLRLESTSGSGTRLTVELPARARSTSTLQPSDTAMASGPVTT